jgi:single-strand DNA-binding protein
MFIDVEVYNRGESGKQADLVRDRCRKGSQVMLEAKLHLDTWDDKQTGQRRTKHKLIAENVQLLDPKQDGGGEFGGQQASQRNGRRPSAAATARRPANDDVPPEDYDGGGHDDADIPF